MILLRKKRQKKRQKNQNEPSFLAKPRELRLRSIRKKTSIFGHISLHNVKVSVKLMNGPVTKERRGFLQQRQKRATKRKPSWSDESKSDKRTGWKTVMTSRRGKIREMVKETIWE